MIAKIKSLGKRLLDGMEQLVKNNELASVFIIGGDYSLPFLLPRQGLGYSEPEIRTYFLQEMFARGFLVLGAHAVSYAHSEEDIERLLSAYAEVLPNLASAIRHKTLPSLLKAVPPQHSTTNWR